MPSGEPAAQIAEDLACPYCGDMHSTLPDRDDFLSNGMEPVTNPAGDFSCPICRTSATDPVRLPCHESHIFCTECMTGWLQQPEVDSCPTCRTVLFENTFEQTIDRTVRDIYVPEQHRAELMTYERESRRELFEDVISALRDRVP